MDFKILITETAIADLKEIVTFVASDDAAAAQRLGEKLLAQAMSLRTMPERHALHDPRRGIRKMPTPPYLVYYTVDKSLGVVNVLHFWHGARRPPKLSQ